MRWLSLDALAEGPPAAAPVLGTVIEVTALRASPVRGRHSR